MNTLTTSLSAQNLPFVARPLLSVLKQITRGTLLFTTPDGHHFIFGNGEAPHADLQLLKWSALGKIFRNGDIGLAECYRDGLIKTRDLTSLLRLGLQNQTSLEKAIHGNRLFNIGYRLRHLLRRNSKQGSARNIQSHYDLGNAFYELWLDNSMTYSSARFHHGFSTDLELAQSEKYRRILAMTGASQGDTILEVGCGWGGFAEFAAGQGIRVHGITLSKRQLAYAKQRIDKAGLSSLVTFELKDYRDLDKQYDHIVSIEMVEAVGEAYWDMYFSKLNESLKPGGTVVIQSIVIGDQHFETYRTGTNFIQQYIFPGGMLPSPQKLNEHALANGFSFGEYEAFGADYAETLRRWRTNFEEKLTQIMQQGFDNSFIQIWRFYLAYCEAGFDEGHIDVLQLQLIRHDNG
jgi:cyclopropane-fatty-acyl-phospholipid synthase